MPVFHHKLHPMAGNSDSYGVPPEDLLAPYGPSLEIYQGAGELILSPERKVDCEFVAGQLENSKTIALCAIRDFVPDLTFGLLERSSLKGMTTDGHSFEIDHVLSETSYLPKPNISGTHLALRVGHLRVSRRSRYSRRQLIFLLVNLNGFYPQITFSYRRVKFTLRPIENATVNLKRLQVLRGVLPTAQLQATTRASSDRVEEAVDEVCYLLSLALGTKIQWVALTEATGASFWLTRHHYSRVTKRYGTLNAVEPRGSDISKFLQCFSDGRYSVARKRFGLTNDVIDTYLDAKAEGDFLEVRALKLVVAVEMLKAAYVDIQDRRSLVLPADEFGSKIPEVKAEIKKIFSASTGQQRKYLYANLLGLNRIPFSFQMRQLCRAIRMRLKDKELRRFVASRNKLVHEGHFYCDRATNDEKEKIAPLSSPVSEWFWLIHFVDRLFLRAIGYEGPYIDWTIPGSPTTKELTPEPK